MSSIANLSREHRSEHHMIPQTRGGGNEYWNRVMLSVEIHSAWHNLFANLLPREVIILIPVIGLETEKRIKSWRILFGDRTREQAIQVVLSEWTPRVVRHKSRRRREKEWREEKRQASL